MSYVENNDIRIYIDPISELYLIGTKIDYISENFSKTCNKKLKNSSKNYSKISSKINTYCYALVIY